MSWKPIPLNFKIKGLHTLILHEINCRPGRIQRINGKLEWDRCLLARQCFALFPQCFPVLTLTASKCMSPPHLSFGSFQLVSFGWHGKLDVSWGFCQLSPKEYHRHLLLHFPHLHHYHHHPYHQGVHDPHHFHQGLPHSQISFFWTPYRFWGSV